MPGHLYKCTARRVTPPHAIASYIGHDGNVENHASKCSRAVYQRYTFLNLYRYCIFRKKMVQGMHAHHARDFVCTIGVLSVGDNARAIRTGVMVIGRLHDKTRQDTGALPTSFC